MPDSFTVTMVLVSFPYTLWHLLHPHNRWTQFPPRVDQLIIWCWVVVKTYTPKTVWKCTCGNFCWSRQMGSFESWPGWYKPKTGGGYKCVLCVAGLSFLQMTLNTSQIICSLFKMGKLDVTPSSYVQASPVTIMCMPFPYIYNSLSILFTLSGLSAYIVYHAAVLNISQ